MPEDCGYSNINNLGKLCNNKLSKEEKCTIMITVIELNIINMEIVCNG